MAGNFTNNMIFLSQLLGDVDSGKIQLPDFQRGWLWDEDRIKSVLASVSCDYPIGAVMLKQAGGSIRFQPRPLEGVTNPTFEIPEHFILDGQQRLTSLFQATIHGAPVTTTNATKQRLERWFYFDISKCLQSPEQREEAIEALPASRKREKIGATAKLDLSSPELEYENLMFPCSAVFSSFDWQVGFLAYWNYAPDKTKMYARFQAEVIQAFVQYQVPVITLTDRIPKVGVCYVFEKANTSGVPLTVFELLTAMYAANDFRLRDDWYGPAESGEEIKATLGILPTLKRQEVLSQVASTDFLQAVAMYHTHRARLAAVEAGKRDDQLPAISGSRGTILDISLDDYLNARKAVLDGFLASGKFMRELHVYRSNYLPYPSQLVPLSVILAELGHAWEGHGIKRAIRQWFWCGVLGELYSGAIETRCARDVLDVLSWVRGGLEPRTITDASFNASRLLTLRTRNSAAYKGIYALLMARGGLDLRTGNPISIQVFEDEAINIHHIFSKKWCAENAIPSREMDCIVNKTAISARTNRIAGSKAPSDYLPTLEKAFGIASDRLDGFLTSHIIDPDLLRRDDFAAFFAARSKALLSLIADAMGIPVAPSAAAAEPTSPINGDNGETNAGDHEEATSGEEF